MTTEKYDIETIDYGTEGWNGILTAFINKVEAYLHTRIMVTLGEAVDQYDALYISKVDGKWYKAQADGTKQPALAIALEEGEADDEIRAHRDGPLLNAGWAWAVGKPVYLSAAVAGALTQTPPGANSQIIGYPTSTTTLLVHIEIPEEAVAETTTTSTSTTTTSTSSSTASSTSTSSSTASSTSTSSSTASSTTSSSSSTTTSSSSSSSTTTS